MTDIDDSAGVVKDEAYYNSLIERVDKIVTEDGADYAHNFQPSLLTWIAREHSVFSLFTDYNRLTYGNRLLLLLCGCVWALEFSLDVTVASDAFFAGWALVTFIYELVIIGLRWLALRFPNNRLCWPVVPCAISGVLLLVIIIRASFVAPHPVLNALIMFFVVMMLSVPIEALVLVARWSLWEQCACCRV